MDARHKVVAVLVFLLVAVIFFYRFVIWSGVNSSRGIDVGSSDAAGGDVGFCKCSSEPVKIYVSPKGSDSWSGLYPEPLPDGSDGPLATLTAARDRLRELKREGKPVVVMVRNGTYRLNTPLTLGPEDSGCEECPVVWQAYPGENPVISGGRPILSFREDRLGETPIWIAELPEAAEGVWRFKQLFVNGERRTRSRLPKRGFYRIASVPSYSGKTLRELQLFEGSDEFAFKPGELKSWRNLEDVEVVILHFWVEERIPIKSVDEARSLVKLKGKTIFALRDGFVEEYPRYYVENVFEALSEPGEWYLDASGLLYYIPKPGEYVNSSEVEAPRLLWRLLEVKGDVSKGKLVENIIIRGLTFEYADWEHVLSPQAAVNVPGAIHLEGARNVVIENCTVRRVGGYAIEVGRGCKGIRIEKCRLYDLGAGGVKVGEQNLPDSELERVEFIDVVENEIRECGRVFYSAVGVWVGQARFVRVLKNKISNLYYTGVSVGWTWGYGESFACCNVVEGNVIHDVGLGLLSDMGGIYTLGVQPGTVIRGNVVYNVNAYQYGGWGIYLDEGSSYITVEGNFVYDTSHGGFHQHYGRLNVVRDNVFAFGREGNVILSKGEEGYTAFIFERNIVLSNGSPIFKGGYAQRFTSRNIVSNRNVLWDLSGNLIICSEQSTGKVYTIEEWQALGYDTVSSFKDPEFVDPVRRDFTLKETSPAFKLGFRRL